MPFTLILIMACTSEPDEPKPTETPSAQIEESRPAFLLSEESAVSIVQTYLQECVLSWNVEYEPVFPDLPYLRRDMKRGAPLPSEQEQRWWMDLAIGTAGDIVWSARYYGAELDYDVRGNPVAEVETWVVIGLGFERAGSGLVTVPGRWKVRAGYRHASPLDAPARLAIEEYKKPLDTSFDPDCSGYSER